MAKYLKIVFLTIFILLCFGEVVFCQKQLDNDSLNKEVSLPGCVIVERNNVIRRILPNPDIKKISRKSLT